MRLPPGGGPEGGIDPPNTRLFDDEETAFEAPSNVGRLTRSPRKVEARPARGSRERGSGLAPRSSYDVPGRASALDERGDRRMVAVGRASGPWRGDPEGDRPARPPPASGPSSPQGPPTSVYVGRISRVTGRGVERRTMHRMERPGCPVPHRRSARSPLLRRALRAKGSADQHATRVAREDAVNGWCQSAGWRGESTDRGRSALGELVDVPLDGRWRSGAFQRPDRRRSCDVEPLRTRSCGRLERCHGSGRDRGGRDPT